MPAPRKIWKRLRTLGGKGDRGVNDACGGGPCSGPRSHGSPLSTWEREAIRLALRARDSAVRSRTRSAPSHSVEHAMTGRVLRLTAKRVLALEAEAAELEAELRELVGKVCPQLLAA